MLHAPPDHAGDVEAIVGPVEIDRLLRHAVIQKHLEAPGKRNDHLLKLPVGVAAPGFTAWNVIDPVDPCNFERHVPFFLDEREVSTVIENFRELYNSGIVNRMKYLHVCRDTCEELSIESMHL